MEWFRFYHNDWLFDETIRSMRSELRLFWVDLLCLASLREERGTVPSNSEVARSLRMKSNVVERFMSELEAAKLVGWSSSEPSVNRQWSFTEASVNRQTTVSEARVILQWTVKQKDRDDVALRVKRSRSKRSVDESSKESGSNVTLQGTGLVTLHETLPVTLQGTGDVTVASPSPAPAPSRTPACAPTGTPTRTPTRGIFLPEKRREESNSIGHDDDQENSRAGASEREQQHQRHDSISPSGIVLKISSNGDSGHAAEEAIATARSEFGDTIASMMDLMSTDIESSLGGRWDCYLAALRMVKRRNKPLVDVHSYALRIAQNYVVKGIPPEPVPFVPEAGVAVGPPVKAWSPEEDEELRLLEEEAAERGRRMREQGKDTWADVKAWSEDQEAQRAARVRKYRQQG